MKTVRSKRLVLRAGRERIYEIDLVELDRDDADRYNVNYRYGWAGSELQEGTRTRDPVSRQLAEQIFDSLVLSRRNHGYSDPSGSEAWLTTVAGSATPSAVDAVDDDVKHPRSARLMVLLDGLARLPDAAAAKLIWRVGQVRLAAAAPILADYCRDAEQAAARVLPYALLRCGHGQPDIIIAGLQLLAERTDPTVSGAANISLSLLSSSEAEVARLRAALPEPVVDALQSARDATACQDVLDYLRLALASMYKGDGSARVDEAEQQQAIVDLYLLSHHVPALRPLLLGILEEVPLQPFLFRGVRRVFKAAEATDDADVFAVLAQRFDTTPSYVVESYGWVLVPHVGRSVQRESVLGRDDGSIVWSDRTRAYFRRRVWRHLRRLGQLDDPNYVALAAACLMRADEAANPPTSKPQWSWSASGEFAMVDIHFPALSRQFVVHNILHGSGRRLKHSGGASLTWRFMAPGAVEARHREEPFPKLWDAAPDRVLSILIGAKSEQVLSFAHRILKDNQSYCLALPVSVLAPLLTAASDARHCFALETVEAQFANGQISAEIIPALFRANRPDSLQLGKTITNARPDLITTNSALAAELILAVRDATKAWQSEFWAQHARHTNAQNVLVEVLDQARIQAWAQDQLREDKHNVRLAAELLAENFANAVKAADLSQLVSLSQSSDVPPQLLAILLAAIRPDGLTAFDPYTLAQSEDGDIQAAAAELLANAGIEELSKHEELVAAFLVSPVDRARTAARSAAIAIAANDRQAAGRLTTKLLHVLYRAEEFEGVRDDIVATMQGPLLEAVRERGADLTWSLLRARSEPARRVGASSLQGFSATDFSLRKIARIGNNDQLIARQWALTALDHRIDEVRAAPNEIFSLLDGEWDDSREAAYDMVRRRVQPQDWSPEAVVGLCDCTTLPAQRFGREILGDMFTKEHAEFFLMRLSEHPAAGFRLTIARLIREYAAGDPARIRKVEPALRTILSRVFTSRAAKDQIHRFLEAEIETGNAQTLGILAQLLETVSATCAVSDKARVLEHIVRLKTKMPELIPGAKILAPEIRSARAEGAH